MPALKNLEGAGAKSGKALEGAKRVDGTVRELASGGHGSEEEEFTTEHTEHTEVKKEG